MHNTQESSCGKCFFGGDQDYGSGSFSNRVYSYIGAGVLEEGTRQEH